MKKQSGEAWQIARSFLHLLPRSPGGMFFVILPQAGGALGIWRAELSPWVRALHRGQRVTALLGMRQLYQNPLCASAWGLFHGRGENSLGMAIMSQWAQEGGEAASSDGHKSPSKPLILLGSEPRSGSALQQ